VLCGDAVQWFEQISAILYGGVCLLLPARISFGTDGWRAVVGDGFDEQSVRLVACATAHVFLTSFLATPQDLGSPRPRIYLGYDTRAHAGDFARIAADTMAACGLDVVLSDRYIPTPTLCWTVRGDAHAIGGVQLTASHNPAGWLGFKVRMADGGASPAEFTNEIESILAASTGTACDTGQSAGSVTVKDLHTPYLQALRDFVNDDLIAKAAPKVVVDPLYGAARGYLADTFEQLGAEVVRLHDDADPTFGGLHPEPIPPWTDAAANLVRSAQAQAGFVTDGDADRVGALDEEGTFVSPHKIIALIAQHLVENRGQSGKIVKTLSTSVLVDRIGRELGAEVVTTPIGFKWIYEEMLKGDVMIGGEESGGIGIPSHVCERDGLLMSLLLAEMMATTGHSLKELVDQLEARVGKLYYQRVDLAIEPAHMTAFRAVLPTLAPTTIANAHVGEHIHTDGAKFLLPDDEWLLLRGSGTEPLVRIYAEAQSPARLVELLEAGKLLVQETR